MDTSLHVGYFFTTGNIFCPLYFCPDLITRGSDTGKLKCAAMEILKREYTQEFMYIFSVAKNASVGVFSLGMGASHCGALSYMSVSNLLMELRRWPDIIGLQVWARCNFFMRILVNNND